MRSMIALLGLVTVVLSGCAVHSHDRHSYHYPQRGHPVIIKSAPVRHYAPPRPVVIRQAPRPLVVQPPRRVAPVMHVAPKPAPGVRPARPYAAPKQPVRETRQNRPAERRDAAPPRQARAERQQAGRPHGQPSRAEAKRRH